MGIVNAARYKEISIDLLIKADWNYKEEDKTLSKKLAENIKRNGQIENLIVRELDSGYYEVINGNHRFDVLTELGARKAFCYDLGKIPNTKAKRIAIETNETKFKVDSLSLGELLKEISLDDDVDLPDMLSTMPYDEQELNDFIALTDFDFDQYSKTPPVEMSDNDLESLQFKLTSTELELWTEWLSKCGKDVSEEGALLKALQIAIDN